MLHFHFAHEETGDTFTALGAMLPDLFRMASRSVRARKGVAATSRAAGHDPKVLRVLSGIEHHLVADAWFHRTDVFKEGERALAEAFGREASTTPRIRLFAHVTWEMCLDGALVRRQGARATLEKLGAAMEGRLPLAHEASGFHLGRKPEEHDAQRFEMRLSRLYDAVQTGELPLGYATSDGVAMRLAGIRAAFGFVPPDKTDLDGWKRAIDSIAARADQGIARLTTARAELLADAT